MSIKETEQYILNQIYEAGLNAIRTTGVETDGQSALLPISPVVSRKIDKTVTNITYIAIAPVGTAEADAVWLCKKVDQTVTNIIRITWAGGGTFSQVATDLTALTYA